MPSTKKVKLFKANVFNIKQEKLSGFLKVVKVVRVYLLDSGKISAYFIV